MAKTRQISSQGYQVTVLDFNGDEGKTPDGVVLFLHGLGAEANQFRDFATHIMRASKLGRKHVRFAGKAILVRPLPGPFPNKYIVARLLHHGTGNGDGMYRLFDTKHRTVT